jgi:hypothetical protein
MSIKITIEASGLRLSGSLRDEALTTLLQLIQEKRDDTVTVPSPVAAAPLQLPTATNEVPNGNGGEDLVKNMLRGLGGAELLNQLKWESFPEKILLLGAWHEARGGNTPWRSADMDDAFSSAKENPPSNFPRDIRSAIKAGWIHNETPRTYIVTRTGWNRIREQLADLHS